MIRKMKIKTKEKAFQPTNTKLKTILPEKI
jgi:hypothetical protein